MLFRSLTIRQRPEMDLFKLETRLLAWMVNHCEEKQKSTWRERYSPWRLVAHLTTFCFSLIKKKRLCGYPSSAEINLPSDFGEDIWKDERSLSCFVSSNINKNCQLLFISNVIAHQLRVSLAPFKQMFKQMQHSVIISSLKLFKIILMFSGSDWQS